jgi:hypothetical protein
MHTLSAVATTPVVCSSPVSNTPFQLARCTRQHLQNWPVWYALTARNDVRTLRRERKLLSWAEGGPPLAAPHKCRALYADMWLAARGTLHPHPARSSINQCSQLHMPSPAARCPDLPRCDALLLHAAQACSCFTVQPQSHDYITHTHTASRALASKMEGPAQPVPSTLARWRYAKSYHIDLGGQRTHKRQPQSVTVKRPIACSVLQKLPELPCARIAQFGLPLPAAPKHCCHGGCLPPVPAGSSQALPPSPRARARFERRPPRCCTRCSRKPRAPPPPQRSAGHAPRRRPGPQPAPPAAGPLPGAQGNGPGWPAGTP